jgi:hypothetical protein
MSAAGLSQASSSGDGFRDLFLLLADMPGSLNSALSISAVDITPNVLSIMLLAAVVASLPTPEPVPDIVAYTVAQRTAQHVLAPGALRHTSTDTHTHPRTRVHTHTHMHTHMRTRASIHRQAWC